MTNVDALSLVVSERGLATLLADIKRRRLGSFLLLNVDWRAFFRQRRRHLATSRSGAHVDDEGRRQHVSGGGSFF